jgi:hypothetical protein
MSGTAMKAASSHGPQNAVSTVAVQTAAVPWPGIFHRAAMISPAPSGSAPASSLPGGETS